MVVPAADRTVIGYHSCKSDVCCVVSQSTAGIVLAHSLAHLSRLIARVVVGVIFVFSSDEKR